MSLEIVIAQRGWVFIGEVSIVSPTEVVITSAKNIRRWGTTKGLGQLATEGPTENTHIDNVGTVLLHPLAIIARMPVTCTEKWK